MRQRNSVMFPEIKFTPEELRQETIDDNERGRILIQETRAEIKKCHRTETAHHKSSDKNKDVHTRLSVTPTRLGKEEKRQVRQNQKHAQFDASSGFDHRRSRSVPPVVQRKNTLLFAVRPDNTKKVTLPPIEVRSPGK